MTKIKENLGISLSKKTIKLGLTFWLVICQLPFLDSYLGNRAVEIEALQPF